MRIMLAAVLDTCVVFNGLRRDLLLSLAAGGAFRLILTEDLLFEFAHVEDRKLRERGMEPLVAQNLSRQLVERIRKTFHIEVEAAVRLVPAVGLPDEYDEHLVAAASVGLANVIVTENLRDLPPHLMPLGVSVRHPDDFLHELTLTDPAAVTAALTAMSMRRTAPPQSESDLIDLLAAKALIRPDTLILLRIAHNRWHQGPA